MGTMATSSGATAWRTSSKTWPKWRCASRASIVASVAWSSTMTSALCCFAGSVLGAGGDVVLATSSSVGGITARRRRPGSAATSQGLLLLRGSSHSEEGLLASPAPALHRLLRRGEHASAVSSDKSDTSSSSLSSRPGALCRRSTSTRATPRSVARTASRAKPGLESSSSSSSSSPESSVSSTACSHDDGAPCARRRRHAHSIARPQRRSPASAAWSRSTSDDPATVRLTVAVANPRHGVASTVVAIDSAPSSTATVAPGGG
mmetsp:Transcript_8570/g.35304  ORF Transcript_8570/g.35304 Transcript_8570/m.35304 type:complete len:262 (+) Transcript_8570:659-1444(+)